MKQARVRVCERCEHWLNRHADVWRWPRCDRTDLYLDDAFMEAPGSDCPLGLWKDLKDVDLDAEAREQAELRITFGVAYWKPVLAALAPDAKDALTVRARLTPLVQALRITPEVAAAVEADVLAAKL
jgi:hypothetical protein